MLVEKKLIFRNPDSWHLLQDGEAVRGVHIWDEDEEFFDCDVVSEGVKDDFFIREADGELSRPTWFMRC